ncbi:MAG: tRNA pseudouridine synthase A [Scrofimicrobium sp.]
MSGATASQKQTPVVEVDCGDPGRDCVRADVDAGPAHSPETETDEIMVSVTTRDTQRVRFDLSYEGSGFHGWATQDGLRTVQGEIEEALATVFREPIRLTVAGRTDAGVHAAHQVAHADIPSGAPAAADLNRLCDRLNRLLSARYSGLARGEDPAVGSPPAANSGAHVHEGSGRRSWTGAPAPFRDRGMSDLVIHRIAAVSDDFDARFSALARHYVYKIVDQREGRDPISRADSWWSPYSDLDAVEMQVAAEVLLGTHDFLSFCKPREGATTIRSLTQLDVTRREGSIQIKVSADAFCHSMVRSLVGALVDVGRGMRDPEWVASLIQHPSRSHGVPIAPARGLTLVRVDYPLEEEWAKRSEQARRVRDISETCCG